MLFHFNSTWKEGGYLGLQRESEGSAGQRVEGRETSYCEDVIAEVQDKSPYKTRLIFLLCGTLFKER